MVSQWCYKGVTSGGERLARRFLAAEAVPVAFRACAVLPVALPVARADRDVPVGKARWGPEVLLQLCHNGVTVVLQWCYSGVTVWCYSGITMILEWCYRMSLLARPGRALKCHNGDTDVSQVCYNSGTML
jgi:hypothetical protein